MNTRIWSLAPVAILTGALSQPVLSADRFAIDPAHTNIAFWVNHLGYSRMLGQFQQFSGEFLYDSEQLENSQVTITIMTDSVDTDHQKRDDHLRSPDFFNAVEFPEMRFESTGVEKTGEQMGMLQGKLHGNLTLLGTTRPVTLEFTLNKVAPHPLPQYNGVLVAGFSARGSVMRSEFGMKYGVPNLGDEIELRLEVEGHKQ